ncbi:hypothetical protein AN958_05303 [Leucoagaricus sp. SymC.cos]|nr:hypothetical protein AN958_05303 [Leucoagaricus sp. SymC.cos]
MSKPTALDILKKAELLKPKVAILTSNTSSFQSTDTFEKALVLHNNALAVKEGVDILIPDIRNVAQPISVADGTKILNFFKELQVSWNSVLEQTITKKPFFDALPVGNMTPLIRQDLRDMHATLMTAANLLIDAAPAELQAEGRALHKAYEDTIKETMAVYQ